MSETATIRGARIAYEQAGAGPELIWGHGLSQTRADESVLGLADGRGFFTSMAAWKPQPATQRTSKR